MSTSTLIQPEQYCPSLTRYERWRTREVRIGDISIGDFAKIGAGSVATEDVPAGCTAVGVPARLTNCPEDAIPA